MTAVVRLIDRLTEGVGFAAALLLIPLVLAMCYEVFARYVLNAPTIWAYEMSYMLSGTYFLLGSGFTLKRRGHIRIDLIYAHVSSRARAMIDLAGYVLVFLPLLVVLNYYLWDYAMQSIESGERSGQSAWNPVIWPFRIMFFAGFAFLALQVVAEILKCVRVIFGAGTQNEG
ncbi:TRAP transporter small permease subunit [Rhodospirillaceae bacterium SYSU D60014]|uniref:TRAP transporter small permease subunit n=1 Tax=Virgifigura deserti TaxID=2268457 RepID=UPI000E66B72B